MFNIVVLKRQHEDIDKIVNNILDTIKKNKVEEKSKDISKDISILAGKLKIHLKEEDRWLYPNIAESDNPKLREFHKTYKNEMENIFDLFMSYKAKYNTKSKILSNVDKFIEESKKVLTILMKRLEKENTELYPILENS
ncbi:hemerythrin domain-containing protein [Thermohalobacter berrensis]|uniref:Hemerythrin-like domain-containing protein n=1 Tax=Thermohalobacter berrensis TaxID=99594 RepID=A0A419T329_9FIRM|nr:hemerythrin domain-containing protein [Thermohalobacter berrensis]RKD31937.1 hypothetical protein BET03_11695 [Thermohalobacter berrensis]